MFLEKARTSNTHAITFQDFVNVVRTLHVIFSFCFPWEKISGIKDNEPLLEFSLGYDSKEV